ncbi:cob(I)yrinic acid a,c-diamide adenosyltransferase [Chloroflexota bacterium]
MTNLSRDLAEEGEVLLFIGHGKGKTSSALGVAGRSIAYGRKVIFIYFTTPPQPLPGEFKAAVTQNDNWRMMGVFNEKDDASNKDELLERIDTVTEAITKAHDIWLKEYDLLVLDDIGRHIDSGAINIVQVMALLEDRPPNTSIIITGESAPQALIEKANLITEFRRIK